MNKTYLRGDIFYADLGKGVGSEQEGYRPVVIIQNNVGNRHSPTVIVAPPYQAVQPRKANYPLTITSGRNVALNSPLSFFWNNCEPLTNAD